MPTLDVRGVVVDNDLSINYHSSRVPDDLQKKFLAEALRLARSIVGHHVLPALAKADSELARAQSLRIEPKLDVMLLTILRTYFRLPAFSGAYSHAVFKLDLATIKRKFTLINNGIGQPVTLADSYSAVVDGRRTEPARGYVRSKAGAVADPVTNKIPTDQRGSVHIDFGMLHTTKTTSKLMTARTIIHESSHKFALTADNSYRYYTDYKTLTKVQALDNADSYAYTAISIYQKKPVTQMTDNLLDL